MNTCIHTSHRSSYASIGSSLYDVLIKFYSTEKYILQKLTKQRSKDFGNLILHIYDNIYSYEYLYWKRHYLFIYNMNLETDKTFIKSTFNQVIKSPMRMWNFQAVHSLGHSWINGEVRLQRLFFEVNLEAVRWYLL